MKDSVELNKTLLYYTKKIDTSPGHDCLSTYYILRSVFNENLENNEKSLNDALQAIKIDAEYWKGHHQALKIHIKLENIHEAEEIAKKYEDDDDFKDLRDALKVLQIKVISRQERNAEMSKYPSDQNQEVTRVEKNSHSSRQISPMRKASRVQTADRSRTKRSREQTLVKIVESPRIEEYETPNRPVKKSLCNCSIL